MNKPLLISIFSLGIIISPSHFSIAQALQKEPSKFTKGNCSDIQRHLNQFDSFNVTSGSGTVTMFKTDYSRFERNGCKVTTYGELSKIKTNAPNLNPYFKDGKWEPVSMYMADGHGSGTMGYFREEKFNDGTFCLKSHDYQISEDEVPSHFKLEVICVDGHKKLIIE